MSIPVSVCIPTYRSAEFLDRTLDCACAQTHRDLRILVSVDPSGDGTGEVAKRRAREDDRIEVVIQTERLGWSGNANAVLDRVETEYFFLYFHDDIIEPTYVEVLLAALEGSPDAASAHCDLVEFGLIETIRPASPYEGSRLRRLVQFMMTRQGTTLRSMVRRSRVRDGLRFPRLRGDSHWTAYVFHLLLLAAGPALAVSQPLYRRWQRDGSLTRSGGWLAPDLEELLQILREAATHGLALIDTTLDDPAERRVARFCLRIFLLRFLRDQQLRLGALRTIDIREISPVLADGGNPSRPVSLDAQAEAWVRAGERQLAELEQELARRNAENGQGRDRP